MSNALDPSVRPLGRLFLTLLRLCNPLCLFRLGQSSEEATHSLAPVANRSVVALARDEVGVLVSPQGRGGASATFERLQEGCNIDGRLEIDIDRGCWLSSGEARSLARPLLVFLLPVMEPVVDNLVDILSLSTIATCRIGSKHSPL